MQLSDQQLYWIIAILFAVTVAGIVFAFYISRKYPKRVAKVNPLYQAVYLFALLFALYLVSFLLGLRTRENFQKDFKWILGTGILLVAFFMLVSWLSKRPIKSIVLYNKYIIPDAREYWKAEVYTGAAYALGMLAHKVIDVQKNKYTSDLGVIEDKVDVFLCQMKAAGNIRKFLSVRNKFTGEDLQMMENPSLEVQRELFGEEVISSYQHPLSAYDTQQETTGLHGEQNPRQDPSSQGG